ncbi:Protein of unknown function [Pyronema omphalodes CBS 100304]|uniref:Uncharacterized protein n=1 Tax=Pyronema omphalodes (strain CBS 100304) TaxID=1076935 RepID=U4LVZ7_PYROM|nr:Protein of unknown function [Pyronema omphalodes CBS 100304]
MQQGGLAQQPLTTAAPIQEQEIAANPLTQTIPEAAKVEQTLATATPIHGRVTFSQPLIPPIHQGEAAQQALLTAIPEAEPVQRTLRIIFVINDGEFNLKACTKPILRYVNALYLHGGENAPEPTFSFITITDDRAIESCVHDPDPDSRAVDIDFLVGKMHYNFHKMESDINLIKIQIPENYRSLKNIFEIKILLESPASEVFTSFRGNQNM